MRGWLARYRYCHVTFDSYFWHSVWHATFPRSHASNPNMNLELGGTGWPGPPNPYLEWAARRNR